MRAITIPSIQPASWGVIHLCIDKTFHYFLKLKRKFAYTVFTEAATWNVILLCIILKLDGLTTSLDCLFFSLGPLHDRITLFLCLMGHKPLRVWQYQDRAVCYLKWTNELSLCEFFLHTINLQLHIIACSKIRQTCFTWGNKIKETFNSRELTTVGFSCSPSFISWCSFSHSSCVQSEKRNQWFLISQTRNLLESLITYSGRSGGRRMAERTIQQLMTRNLLHELNKEMLITLHIIQTDLRKPSCMTTILSFQLPSRTHTTEKQASLQRALLTLCCHKPA